MQDGERRSSQAGCGEQLQRSSRSGAGEEGEVLAGEGGGGWPPRGQYQSPDRRGQVGYEDGPGIFAGNEGHHLDWESITAIIQEGERGKIVEVEDEVDHKTVRVWVE